MIQSFDLTNQPKTNYNINTKEKIFRAASDPKISRDIIEKVRHGIKTGEPIELVIDGETIILKRV